MRQTGARRSRHHRGEQHRWRAQQLAHARRGDRRGGSGGAGRSVADWKRRGGQGQGLLLAVAVFLAMFTLYIANHPAGLTVPVATTAANKAVLLALVAMAQTLPVLTGGLDLSVGMVFVMTNCLASSIVSGEPRSEEHTSELPSLMRNSFSVFCLK